MRERRFENIILIGFMGTGKSSVGHALADRLGWSYADTDAEIERVSQQTIPSIFAEQGEIAFRTIESKVLVKVLSGGRQVIATGGGAVLAAANQVCMLSNGWVVRLTADAETIIARVTKDPQRPLLAGNVSERVYRLLQDRAHAYDFADQMIQTDALTIDEIVEQIVERFSSLN